MPGRPFPKGISGNPGGRPRGFARVFRELLGDDVPEMARIAWDIARGECALPTEDVKPDTLRPSYHIRLEALKFIRDSGWGRPVQTLELNQKGGNGAQVAPSALQEFSDDELELLERALNRAESKAGEPGDGAVDPVPGGGQGGEGSSEPH